MLGRLDRVKRTPQDPLSRGKTAAELAEEQGYHEVSSMLEEIEARIDLDSGRPRDVVFVAIARLRCLEMRILNSSIAIG